MSFLSDYRDFTEGSEAPQTFHTFTALVCLASIVNRRVWIDLGYFNVFPNLYVVLVGPPGSRKTSAMSVGKQLLREVGDVPFSAECVTKEKLILDMIAEEKVIPNLPKEHQKFQVYTGFTVMVTELSQFLGANSAHMVDFLTTVYDQDIYENRTKHKGCDVINGPGLSVLACTTPAWITARMRDDVISGGFSRRAVFVYEADRDKRIAFPEVSNAAKLAWDSAIARAKQLKSVAGPFSWTPEAREFYSHWYEHHKIPDDSTVSGYYESKHIQLLKIAMLISLSENTSKVLSKDNLEFGLGLLGLSERNLATVFAGIGRNELNAAASVVVETLKRAKTVQVKGNEGAIISYPCAMPEKQLRAELFRLVNAQELTEVLNHLCQTDQTARFTTQDGVVTRVFIYYKGGKLPPHTSSSQPSPVVPPPDSARPVTGSPPTAPAVNLPSKKLVP